MRPKRPTPRTDIPNWRDFTMPLERKGRLIDPTKLTEVCQRSLERSPEPHFTQDPTYNLRRRPK